MGHHPLELKVRREGPIGDGPADQLDILVDDATGAEVQMAYIRVPHLAGHQPYALAGSRQPTGWIIPHQFIDIGSLSLGHRIALTRIADPPTIENDQDYFPRLI
jgi:hypothetical protein